jgi:2-polyprenyl-3-methyl-5-hydroxy-6-metoxy-1,4-benzoquinol methylase
VTQAPARYDEFAEWYEQWIGDGPPLIAAHSELLPTVTGERVLDIACGQGRMSRYLARLGADVTGVDISAAMLSKARATSPDDIAMSARTSPDTPPGGRGGPSTAVLASWR